MGYSSGHGGTKYRIEISKKIEKGPYKGFFKVYMILPDEIYTGPLAKTYREVVNIISESLRDMPLDAEILTIKKVKIKVGKGLERLRKLLVQQNPEVEFC